ncbi:hypothetical protein [Anaerocolumna xylanovorans]|uniref:Uncharacterized protein n=1 Tax=Anaerocolumna xylanovorans DSM 12503 TaxID=1121345 RepID=A0A1M7XYL1_9FIRM|nr:hypothetical protein [Anaerocolumna xylanovorans]SHO44152.1 hypothetical protein SAMN02745217_00479 [Anaerocolumna xylanovorans DSM 12503]
MANYMNYKIDKDSYHENKDLRLEKVYEMCVQELGLQQSKRDQIIAFYIAIISFVIPAIIGLDVNRYAKGAGFFALYILGSMLAKVVVRYRIYKEVYWITCRTVTQLYNFKEEKINKLLVQSIFYNTLAKNRKTVIVFQDEKGKTGKNEKRVEEKGKVDKWKTYIKIRNSSETILYEVLILLSSLVLWIGIFILCSSGLYGGIAAAVIIIGNYIYWNIYYYKSLMDVYGILTDGKDESFNFAYSKAWFLHGFYSED